MPVKLGGLTEILSRIQKYKYIVVIMVLGFVLLVLPQGKVPETGKMEKLQFDTKAFEKRIEEALSGCEGVGRVRVILSMKSGPLQELAKEETKNVTKKEGGEVTTSNSDTSPSIISEGSGREEPIVIREIYPEFRGAVVVCDGADDIRIEEKVTRSVSVLTGLRSDKISVIKMKN